MTGEELRGARIILGNMWGRRVSCADLADALRLRGKDPGKMVSEMEHDARPISGPISVCIEMWLAGSAPPP